MMQKKICLKPYWLLGMNRIFKVNKKDMVATIYFFYGLLDLLLVPIVEEVNIFFDNGD